MLAGIGRLLAADAAATVLLSVVPRDGAPAPRAPAELAAACARHGLSLMEARAATPTEVAASGSSWATRLRAGQARRVTLLRLRAAGGQSAPNNAAMGATASGALESPVTRRTG